MVQQTAGPLQARSRRMAQVIIWRLGDEITIWRPDGTEPLNKFHKKDDTDITFTEVSTDEKAAPAARMTRDPVAIGGRANQSEPDIYLAWDTDTQAGDKLEFTETGHEFHVRDIDDFLMYQVAHTTFIDPDANI